MEIKEVMELAESINAQMVDLKFMDFIGQWQHMTIPIERFDQSIFEEGIGFDGSSIRGWTSINESDMLLIPDPETAAIDPFSNVPVISLICNVYDPITKERYSRDPRNICVKAEYHLKHTGIADKAYFGAEAEFFVFDEVRYDQKEHCGYYFIKSKEGIWTSGDEESPNLAYKIPFKRGYAPAMPNDSMFDIRVEMVQKLQMVGLKVECHHHEVATAGQMEIDFKFDTLTRSADALMYFKYIVKNVARKHNKVASFMPKPIWGDNGCGMHTHQSLWKNEQPIFAGDRYAGLSELALFYIGGLLKHSPALAAFVAPTVNSYHRLVPGFEAPVRLAYSRRNRSAAIRIPMYSEAPHAKRIEYRPPDPSCNPYLAFAAMLMAGLDGIENRIEPGPPFDKDIYGLPPEELKDIPCLPGNLNEALAALENDYYFLLKGDVFTEDVIKTWIKYKRENEIVPLSLRPHPYEFYLYFDI